MGKLESILNSFEKTLNSYESACGHWNTFKNKIKSAMKGKKYHEYLELKEDAFTVKIFGHTFKVYLVFNTDESRVNYERKRGESWQSSGCIKFNSIRGTTKSGNMMGSDETTIEHLEILNRIVRTA